MPDREKLPKWVRITDEHRGALMDTFIQKVSMNPLELVKFDLWLRAISGRDPTEFTEVITACDEMRPEPGRTIGISVDELVSRCNRAAAAMDTFLERED